MIAPESLSVATTVPFMALTFSTRATLLTLNQHNHVPGELYTEAEQLGLTPTGPIQYIYAGVSGDETNEFGLEIVLPVAHTQAKPFGFSLKTFAPFRCVSYEYTGPWDELPAVYDALFPAFYQAGHKYNGHIREVYTATDFDNPNNHVTEIQVGLV